MLICPECGAANFPKAKYCKACGKGLDLAQENAAHTTVCSPDHSPSTADSTPSFEGHAQTGEIAVSPSSDADRIPSDSVKQVDANETTGPLEQIAVSPVPDPVQADPAASAEPGDSCPLLAELNFNRVLVAENASTFQLRVTNRSHLPMENLTVSMEAQRTLDAPLASTFRRLAPGQSLTRLLEIEPSRPGNYRLQCEVAFQSGGEKAAYTAARPLRVNAKPDTSNIVINIRDIQSNREGQANAALGAEYGDINISNLVDSRSIRSLNDLLELELPDRFEPLDLDLDYQLTMRGLVSIEKNLAAPVSIPPRLLGVCQTGECLELQPIRGTTEPVLLVARHHFLIGRSRQDADLVAWILPRSEANDSLTRRVSKLHARLEISPDGFLVSEIDGASNGTSYNELPVSPSQPAMLERRGELSLGNALALDVQCFPSKFENRLPNISNIRLWAGPPPGKEPCRGAVRLLPVSGAPLPVQAVWLLSDAEFGTSHHNGVVIPAPSLAEIQGRFIFHRGCFWLENAAPNNAVSIDGHPLEAGHIAPLATGQTLQLGGFEFRASIRRPRA